MPAHKYEYREVVTVGSIASVFYDREVQWKSFTGSNSRTKEASYSEPVDSKCKRYGPRKYKRESDNEYVDADYIYRTDDDVKEKDMYDGYIVKRVEVNTLLGVTAREVYVSNE